MIRFGYYISINMIKILSIGLLLVIALQAPLSDKMSKVPVRFLSFRAMEKISPLASMPATWILNLQNGLLTMSL